MPPANETFPKPAGREVVSPGKTPRLSALLLPERFPALLCPIRPLVPLQAFLRHGSYRCARSNLTAAFRLPVRVFPVDADDFSEWAHNPAAI